MQRRSFLALLGVSAGAGVSWLLGGCIEQGTSWVPTGRLLVPVPIDDDEYVPASSTQPTAVVQATWEPNPSWQARAVQLEAFGVFTEEAPGPWAGRERSHVPTLVRDTVMPERVTVMVSHIMSNGPRGVSGTPDAATVPGSDDAGDVWSPNPEVEDAAVDAELAAESGLEGDDAEAPAPPPPQNLLAPLAPVDEPYHFTTTIYVKADSGEVLGLLELRPTDAEPPVITFVLPRGVGSLTAYAACNLHGLWSSSPLAVNS